MISFLTYFLLLCIPILLILIVRLKRRRRVVYSHAFLSPFQDFSVKDFLFRTFQLYFDIISDLLIALILALFLSGLLTFSLKKTAVCLDGSYSMLAGTSETPLDRALQMVFERAEKHRFFILAFDPAKSKSRVFSLGRLSRFDTPKEAARWLRSSFIFFNQDESRLEWLFRRGFQKVIYFTDRAQPRQGSLDIVDVGLGRRGFFYPQTVKWDYSTETFVIHLQRYNYDLQIVVERFEEDVGEYIPFTSMENYSREKNSLNFELREEGLYRLRGPDMDFALALEKPHIRAQARGSYSQIVLDVLPQLVKGKGGVLLADLEYRQDEVADLARQIRSLGKQDAMILTVLPRGEIDASPYIHSLERSLSLPSYTEFPPSLFPLKINPQNTVLFYQDPGRINDEQTPIVYSSYLQPSPFPQTTALKLSRDRSGITSYVYRAGDRYSSLNLAPEELFPLQKQEPLTFGSRKIPHLLYAVLLLLLYILKLSFLYLLHNRGYGESRI